MPFVGSLNRAIIIGNIANDPVLSYTQQTNTPVCKFTVATNRKYKTQAGELKEEASFHRIMVWGSRAENLSKILTKGTKVYVEGRIVYIPREAGERTYKEAYIRASDIIILSRKRPADGSVSNASSSNSAPSASADDADAILDLEKIADGLTNDAENASKEESKDADVKDADKDAKQGDTPEDDLPF